jgi:glycosyltransferase involved in cell wall biosynthesis
VIEHGIDRPSYRAKYISREAINIAYLGAFTVEKGARYFLELARKCSDVHGPSKVNFHIIGELGYPLPGNIRGCMNLSIEGSYRLDQLHRLLSDNNIDLVLFFPIWPETFSYTLSESVIHGIPVIASDIGALRERVSEKSLGYLVPYENPVPFAEEIVEDFLKYPELHEYFRHHCLAYGREMTDVRGMAKEYMDIYTASVSLNALI